MKRLDQTLDIGPKYATDFERAGIRNVRDLATIGDLTGVSRHTNIPIAEVQRWHEKAKQKLKTTRYRRRVAVGVAIVALAALGWLFTATGRAPARISEQAGALYDKGDYKQALELYEKVIQLDPKYQSAYANKGGALARLGRTEDALAALNKALELDPKDFWAYTQRGDLYSDLGNYEAAIRDYDQAIELDSRYKFAYGGKCLALSKLGRYDDALGAVNKAIDLDPKDMWAYSVRGSIYHDNLYQYEKAYQDLKKTSEGGPSRVSYETDVAEAALTSGRFQEAFALASKIWLYSKICG